jgi:hypothetical protein
VFPRVVEIPTSSVIDIVLGVATIYEDETDTFPWGVDFTTPYFSVSVSLNFILTLMLVVRLAIHHRNIRKVAGLGAGGLYKAVISMLVESCSLYAVSLILYIGVEAAGSPVQLLFFPIISETQVRAGFFFLSDATKSLYIVI